MPHSRSKEQSSNASNTNGVHPLNRMEKKKSAKKAKYSDFGKNFNPRQDRRAARHDVNWRADDLDDQDIWKKKTPPAERKKKS